MMRAAVPGALLAATLLVATACSPTTPAIEPVVVDVGDLQGETVELEVGQVLDIDTGDLAVDSYSGEVEDPAVAEFVHGHESYGSVSNPGVKGLAEGTTKVVLSNDDGGIQDVTFTVEVSE